MANQTLEALRKLKVDCLYKKGTHANAARRVQKHSETFQIALIVGTIFASFSTIMNVGIWDKIPGANITVQVIVNILGAMGGFMILYTTTFSDYKSKLELANKHETISNELNMTFKKIRSVEATYVDRLIPDEVLVKSLDELTNEYISKCKNVPITKDEDFLKARENFKDGFSAEYTVEELNS